MSKEETQPEAQGVYAFKVRKNDIVRVRCPKGLVHGQQDAQGDVIYENSHYATYEEAQRKLVSNVKYLLEVRVENVKDRKEELRKAEQMLLDHAVLALDIFKAHGWR